MKHKKLFLKAVSLYLVPIFLFTTLNSGICTALDSNEDTEGTAQIEEFEELADIRQSSADDLKQLQEEDETKVKQVQEEDETSVPRGSFSDEENKENDVTEDIKTDEDDNLSTEPSEVSESEDPTEPTESVETEPVSDTDITETSEPTDISEPEETSAVTEPTDVDSTEPSETEASEPTAIPTEIPRVLPTTEPTKVPVVSSAFEKEYEVDGFKISLTADPGVLPEGAYAEVSLITDKTELPKIKEVKGQVVSDSITFDITLFDKDGNEIQPEEGSVKVAIAEDRLFDKNLDVSVYHTHDDKTDKVEYVYVDAKDKETENINKAEALVIEASEFSYYTVEFTYNEMQYVLPGNSSVALSVILDKVGLEGSVTKAVSSNPALFKVVKNRLYALKSFTSQETLTLTINGIDYIINVSDAPGDSATVGTDAYYIVYDTGLMVVQKGDTPDPDEGNVLYSGLFGTSNVLTMTQGNASAITDFRVDCDVYGMTSWNQLFMNCSNLETIEGLDRIDVSNCTSGWAPMFMGVNKVREIDCSDWTLPSPGMSCMGGWLSGLTGPVKFDFSNWIITDLASNAGPGRGMGGNGVEITEIDVTGWDLGNETSLGAFFAGSRVKKITGLDTWDTSNITDFSQLFQGCAELMSMDGYEDFDTSNATNMSIMFQGSTFSSIDISGYDTSKVTDVSYMFANCSNLTSISWPQGPCFENVTNFDYMFNYCTSLETLDLSMIDFSNAVSAENMFNNTTNLTQLTLPASFKVGGTSLSGNWKDTTTGVVYSGDALSYVEHTETRTYIKTTEDPDLDVAYCASDAYYVLYEDGTLVFQKGNTRETEKYGNNVYGPVRLNSTTQLNSNAKNGAKKVVVKDVIVGRTAMNQFFDNMPLCEEYTSLDRFDVSAVTTFRDCFRRNSLLKELDISGWDFSSIESSDTVYRMFGSTSLEKLTVGPKFQTMGYANQTAFGTAGTWVKKETGTVYTNLLLSALGSSHPEGTYLKVIDTLRFYPMGGASSFTSSYVTAEGTYPEGFPTVTREGYDFLGWYSDATAGDLYTEYDEASGVKSFYAHWFTDAAASYNIVLHENKGAGSETVNVEVLCGDTFTLPTDPFTNPSDPPIAEWNTKANGTGTSYKAGKGYYNLADQGETLTLYAIYARFNNVTAHYINIITGEEIMTKQLTVKENGTFVDFNPSVEYYEYLDDQSFVYFWSKLSNLDVAHYENPYNYSSWSYNYSGEDSNPQQLIHMGNTRFTSDVTDVYAYVIPPAEAVMHFAGFIEDQVGPISFDYKGTTYGSGDYVIRTPYEMSSYDMHTAFSSDFNVRLQKNWTLGSIYIPSEIYNDFIWSHSFISDPGARFGTDNMLNESGQLDWAKEVGNYRSNWEYNPDTGNYEEVFEYDYRAYYGKSIDFYAVPYMKLTLDAQNGGSTSTYGFYPGSSNMPTDLLNFYVPSDNSYMLSAPSRTGYTFDGWYTDPDAGTKIEVNTVFDFTVNNTLYAHWTPESGDPTTTPEPTPADHLVPGEWITIHFNLEGGHFVRNREETNRVNKGTRLGLYSYRAEKDDMYFEGWFTQPNGQGTKIDKYTVFNQDTELYAYFTNYVTIYFDPQDADSYIRGITEWDSDLGQGFYRTPSDGTLRSLPGAVKTDQYLVGWYDTNNTLLTLDTTNFVDGTVYHPVWAPIEQNISEGGYEYSFEARFSSSDRLNVTESENTNLLINLSVGQTVQAIPAGGVKIILPDISEYRDYVVSQMPEYPNTSESHPFFSYYSISDTQKGLTNSVELTGGFGLGLGILGSVKVRQPVEFDIQFLVDTDLDGTYETQATQHMTIMPNYSDKNDSASFGDGHGNTWYANWNPSWGEAPADSGDYFYVVWEYDAEPGIIEHTQVYVYDCENQPGELVGYGSSLYDIKTYRTSGSWIVDNAGSGKAFVLYKYPWSMLDPESGRATLTLTQRLVWTPRLAGGYVYDRPSYDDQDSEIYKTTEEYVVYWTPIHRDEANFTIGIKDPQTERVQKGLRDPFVAADVPITDIGWILDYKNIAMTETVGTGSEQTGRDLTEVITLRQGPGDLIYSSGAPSDYYMMNPSTGNKTLLEEDYEFNGLRVTVQQPEYSAWSADEDVRWTNKMPITDGERTFEVWIRREGEDRLQKYATRTVYLYSIGTENFSLPENVVEWEVRLNTQGSYYNGIKVQAGIKIKPTQHTYDLFYPDYAQDTAGIVKMYGTATVTPVDSQTGAEPVSVRIDNVTMATESALLDLYELTSTTAKSPVLKTNSIQIDNSDVASEELSYRYISIPGISAVGTVKDEGGIAYGTNMAGFNPVEKGTFYILMPSHIDVSNIQVRAKKQTSNPNDSSIYDNLTSLNSDYYSYTIEEQYNGTDYTLFTVNINVPGSKYNEYLVYADYVMSYNDAAFFGNAKTFYWLFVDESSTRPNYVASDKAFNTLPASEQKTILSSINRQHEQAGDYVAAHYSNVSFKKVTTYEYGFGAYMASENDTYKNTGTEIAPGEDYKTKFTYAQSPTESVDSLKINIIPDEFGSFKSLIVPKLNGYTDYGSTATSSGVVWYTTNETPDWDHVDAAHGWTSVPPVGQKVTGIRVDYSSCDGYGGTFKLGNGSSRTAFNIVLTQTLDGEAFIPGESVTDSANLYKRRYVGDNPEDEVTASAATAAGVQALPSLYVSKTSDPASGTQDNPAPVFASDSINYTIRVYNWTNHIVHDVRVVDVIPAGLTMDTANIKVGGFDINSHSNVKSYDLTNGVDVVINKIGGNEWVEITIPCKVTAEVGRPVFANTAYVTEIGNYVLTTDEVFESETTYHVLNAIPEPTGFIDRTTIWASLAVISALAFVGARKFKKKEVEA